MHALILQLQLLLAALGALLPLVPARSRARLAQIVDLAGQALRLGDAAADQVEALARRLAAVRADVERMAADGAPVSADRIDEAWTRVAAASRAFREAAGEA